MNISVKNPGLVEDTRDLQPMLGIMLKIMSVTVFVAMSSFIKLAGDLPAGQIVFFRSAFALLPLFVMLSSQGKLRTAFYTKHPFSHLARGMVGVTAMSMTFFALTRLPLPDAITLNYAQPLFVVLFSAVFLSENVRIYRWAAVAVGMVGVVIISWPKLTLFSSGEPFGEAQAAGAIAALMGAAASAVAMLLVRRLVFTEQSATIVLYFSISASLIALLSLPFGWSALSWSQFSFLVAAGICGGIAQVLMTESYRYAEASTVAPFEYTSIIIALLAGYVLFGDLATIHMIIGGAIVVSAGLFIIWREKKLDRRRLAARSVNPLSA